MSKRHVPGLWLLLALMAGIKPAMGAEIPGSAGSSPGEARPGDVVAGDGLARGLTTDTIAQANSHTIAQAITPNSPANSQANSHAIALKTNTNSHTIAQAITPANSHAIAQAITPAIAPETNPNSHTIAQEIGCISPWR
jgi:hypothetical protein